MRDIRCPVAYLKANMQYGKNGVLYAANTDEDTERAQALISGCERIDIKSGMTPTPSIRIRSSRLVKDCWKDRLGNIDARHDILGFEVTVDHSGRVGSVSAIAVKGMLTLRAWAYRPSVAVVGTGLPVDHA